MAATRKVEIYGQGYSLRGEAGNEKELEELAAYVDETMRRIAAGTPTVDTLKISILAAVHLTHELFEARRQMERLEEEINKRADKLGSILARALE